MTKKNAAAAELGRARWKGVSKEERSEHASMAVSKRYAGTTPEERSAAAKNAAVKRWAKVKATNKAAKKSPGGKK